MLTWLRRLIKKLERRWIPDDDERGRYDTRVRRRLRGDPAEDLPPEPDDELPEDDDPVVPPPAP